MITKEQIRKIHALKNTLKLDEDLYREILSGYGVYSSKELAFYLADELISQLENMAVEAGVWVIPSKKFNELNNRNQMATAKQLRMLEAMWKEVAYVKTGDFVRTSFRNFLYKQFKISDMRFLKKSMVSKVAKAIQAIKENKTISNVV